MNYVSSNYPKAQSMSEPHDRVEGTYYYAVSARTDLQTIFKEIISIVTSGTAYQDVTMTVHCRTTSSSRNQMRRTSTRSWSSVTRMARRWTRPRSD